MRNKFFLCLFVLVSLTACKDTKWVEVPGGMPPEGAITDSREWMIRLRKH